MIDLESLSTEIKLHTKESDRRYDQVSEDIKAIHAQLKSLGENKVGYKQFWATIGVGISLISFLFTIILNQINDLRSAENKHFDYLQQQISIMQQDVSNLKGKLDPFDRVEIIK